MAIVLCDLFIRLRFAEINLVFLLQPVKHPARRMPLFSSGPFVFFQPLVDLFLYRSSLERRLLASFGGGRLKSS